MKRNAYLFTASLIAIVFFAGCKKTKSTEDIQPTPINVVQVQNALVVEPTATWCGPCGQYGKPATDKAITGNAKVVPIYAHLQAPASDLKSQTGQDFAVIYGAANANGTQYSIPQIAVGDHITGAYQSTDYTAGILTGWINEITAQTSKANTKIEATVEGGMLKVKTNTKFFEDGANGSTYKITVVLTEDNISNKQNYSSTGYKMITHNHVTRATLTASTFGDDILASGVPANGQIIAKDFSIALNSAWKTTDLNVIAIIWKMDGTTRHFVNADQLQID